MTKDIKQRIKDKQDEIDQRFITFLNLKAVAYGLQIDWNRSDYFKRQLSFAGNPSDEDLMKFFEDIQRNFPNIEIE